jgi:Asp-tRNA(Asn)/Glu-tRNA(Gln) amidotransferase A subunit family amidase
LAFVDDLGEQTTDAVSVQMRLLQEKLQHHHQVFSQCGLADLIHKADAPLFTVLEGEAAQSFASLLQAQSLPPSLAKRLDKGTRWGAQDLQQAREAAVALHAQWQTLVPQDTCVILPAMPCRTPDIDHCTPGHADFSARALYALSAFTRLGSLLGLPVVTIPVGRDEAGAPLAIQIMGHRGQDRSVLTTALRLQELCAFEQERRGM